MNLSVGIVGLPNVGKSTLFNALLKKQVAFVANYPFATIEPNVGVVPVPDERLQKLAEIVERDSSTPPSASLGMTNKRPPIVPATVKFVDIAGLVKGAAEGAGLGNKFLSHIREVSIIAHVVRAFEDPNIIKEGSVDPKSDYETIQTELILADLQAVQNQESRIRNQGKTKELLKKLRQNLDRGISARSIQLTEEEKEELRNLFLLSAKPEIIVLNVTEQDYTSQKIPEIVSKYSELLYPVIASDPPAGGERSNLKGIASSPVRLSLTDPRNDNMVVICAKIESELAELSEDEQREYLKGLGLEQSGLERLIQKAYETLGLISFLTAGDKEVRAWTIKRGEIAQRAAGEIHTDFIKKFIKAETLPFEDFVTLGGWKKAREKGKARMEGRDYIVKDGDVIEFKIGS